jgi:hypothetical protein
MRENLLQKNHDGGNEPEQATGDRGKWKNAKHIKRVE